MDLWGIPSINWSFLQEKIFHSRAEPDFSECFFERLAKGERMQLAHWNKKILVGHVTRQNKPNMWYQTTLFRWELLPIDAVSIFNMISETMVGTSFLYNQLVIAFVFRENLSDRCTSWPAIAQSGGIK
jgi:hypothetical protein